MAKDLADLVVSLELQTAKYQAGFDSATKRLEKFHKETSEGLKGIAELFAEYLTADAIFEFAKKTIEASASLIDFSKAAGISVEALSALQFAAKAGGVGTEELNTSLKKLNVAISDAAGNSTGKAALAFQLLGVNIKNANGSLKDADTVFKEVADAYAATADGANKAAISSALFGKAGVELTSTLDKGSKGLRELADAAAAAGAIIDGPTAEAAKAFTEKLELLKVTLVDGIGAQVEKNLLPALNSLASAFLDDTKGADGLKTIASEVTTGFRLLGTAGLIVAEAFREGGDAIAGAAAAANAAAHGHFKEAFAILNDQSANAKKNFANFTASLATLWDADGSHLLDEIEITAKKMKATLGSLSGLELFTSAKKELQAFVDGLQGELAKLDQGKVAATNYALAHGKLKEAMAATGAEGKRLAAEAVTAATKLETIEITKQVESLQASLESLGGNTAGAALLSFSKSVETLEKHLKEVGGQTQANAQATIDALTKETALLAAFNQEQQQAARINEDAALAEQAVNNKLQAHQISSLEAERQIQIIREKTLSQLEAIKQQEDLIAAASNNPAIAQGAKQLGGAVDALTAKTDALTNSVRTGLEDAFAHNFSDLITGAKSFGDAITGLLKDVEKQFADLIAKNFAQQLFGAATGGSGGGALSGVAPFLAGIFGGAHAAGGTIPAGKIGLVGERGPELIMGASGGTAVTPNSAIGGNTTINQNFTVQAPNGQISRASQQQVAAAAARGIFQANRRNN